MTFAIPLLTNAGSAVAVVRSLYVKSLEENSSCTKNDPLNSAVENPSTYKMSAALKLCGVVAVAYIKSVLASAVLRISLSRFTVNLILLTDPIPLISAIFGLSVFGTVVMLLPSDTTSPGINVESENTSMICTL